jgi:hypothetical protein
MDEMNESRLESSPPAGGGLSEPLLTRRRFLQTGVTGLGVIALGAMGAAFPAPLRAQASPLHLTMREALVEMIDESEVYMWLFDDGVAPAVTPRFPGPVIYVTEGDRVQIDVSNDISGAQHGFEIPGVVHSGEIEFNSLRTVNFTAPPAGTYIYQDPYNSPINRVMGLHGVLVSMPRRSNGTPYTTLTPQVRSLFRDLGTTARFPGVRWAPDQSVIWVFHQIDPALNERVGNGVFGYGDFIEPDVFEDDFAPSYFTINGRSGFVASSARDTVLSSTVGFPHLIRNVNTGLWAHSPHVHANHAYRVAANGQVQNNVYLLDTWTIKPMDRVDMIFPFTIPPDIPAETWQKVLDRNQEEPFPMIYPMHCHTELSQTAAGGNYPHGISAHLVFLGPHDVIAHPGNPPAGYPTVHDHEHIEELEMALMEARPGTPEHRRRPRPEPFNL